MIDSFILNLRFLLIFVTASTLANSISFAQNTQVPVDAQRDFKTWSTIARSNNVSPATKEVNDIYHEWRGADGRISTVVVKQPVTPRNERTISIGALAKGVDATPIFIEAIKKSKLLKASRIDISTGVYEFKSHSAVAHIVLEDLSDVTIYGNGSTLSFSGSVAGIVMRGLQRVKITNVSLRFDLNIATLYRVRAEGPNRSLVPISDAKDNSASSGITNIAAFDIGTMNWVKNGIRLIFPPGRANDLIVDYLGVIRSHTFGSLKPGDVYLGYHYYYGPPVIWVNDPPQNNLSNDIVIDKVTISAGPGMGIVVYRMGRGFALIDSKIEASPSSVPISTLYDAVNIFFSQGDIAIIRNVIARQGDDALNISSPISKISTVKELGGSRFEISTWNHSQAIIKSDRLAFFKSSDGRFVGTGTVIDAFGASGPGNNKLIVRTDNFEINSSMFLRNITFGQGRFAILDNYIHSCYCHAFLLQVPNGILSGNIVENIKANALKLATNVRQWREGIGAFNILVDHNIFKNSGKDSNLDFPFGVISGYAVYDDGHDFDSLGNDFIEIRDNVIERYQQRCISISSSSNVTVVDNICDGNAGDDVLLK